MDFKLKLDDQLLDSRMKGINRLRDGIYELRDKVVIVYEDNEKKNAEIADRAERIRAALEGKFVGVNKRAIEIEKSINKDIKLTRTDLKKTQDAVSEIDDTLSELIKKYEREEELELKTLKDIRKAIVTLDERIVAIETKPGFWKKVGRFFKRLVFFWR